MDTKDKMDIWVWKNWGEYTTKPAMYESLAEECVELAKAALKAARVLRKENPTPVTMEEACAATNEELTDVLSCAIALGLRVNSEQAVEKFRRMLQRRSAQ